MPPLTEDRIRAVLQTVKFPGFSRDIVSFGLIKSIAITGANDVTVALHVASRETGVYAPHRMPRGTPTTDEIANPRNIVLMLNARLWWSQSSSRRIGGV